jgi:kumamolisin
MVSQKLKFEVKGTDHILNTNTPPGVKPGSGCPTGVGLTKYLEKLDDYHNISTTWILNKNLNGQELNSLTNEIIEYSKKYNLEVHSDYPYHLKVIGKSVDFTNALEINLQKYQQNDHIYHATSELVKLPIEWEGKIDNILGLNTAKVARSYVRKLDNSNLNLNPNASPNAPTVFNALQLATLYNFPKNLNGTGQKIGIIELGGGYVLSDIKTYLSSLGISTNPNVTAVSVDGATNNPSDTSGANVEVILDIEIIAALAPAASIFVYFAPNTDQGFYDAINAAINNGCSLISISWGGPENQWASTTLTSYNNLFNTASTKNVTILVAAGDQGSSDGETGNNVDFPASSPYALGCGGTSLYTNDGTNISNEVVWDNNPSSATGGGISKVFTEPSYQSSVTFPLTGKRGVPDVAADADPNTGYVIYSQSEGGSIVVGGTSAVAPLWTGLLARINQSIGHNVGFLQPIIYANKSAFHDITQGNNGTYSATVGWDPCTGCGSPNGQLILNVFSGAGGGSTIPHAAFSVSSLTASFTDSSTNSPTSWLWNFGDGTTSTLQNPTHKYTASGSYSVTLTATNSAGSNAFTKTILLSVC